MNEPIKKRTEVENPLSFLTIKERIAALLYTYLQQSKQVLSVCHVGTHHNVEGYTLSELDKTYV